MIFETLRNKFKIILSLILTVSLVLSLAGCKQEETASDWKYDEQTAEEILDEFVKIAEIPRQTGSCDDISDYMYSCFEELGLETLCDVYGNLIVTVPASEGLEDRPVTILQSNMDMVCAPQAAATASIIDSEGNLVEDEGYTGSYNPLTDGISTIYSDGVLKGADTALGAESGMAMSIILKYLSGDAKHGPLKIILTVDGLDSFSGSNSLDEKYLSDADYLINLNAGSSDKVYTASLGEKTLIMIKDNPGQAEAANSSCYALRAYGLVGGDAADSFSKSRLNAGLVLLDLIAKLSEEKINFELSSLYGGSGTDSIISDATAIILFDEAELDKAWGIISDEVSKYKTDYGDSEQSFELSLTETNMVQSVMSKEALNQALALAEDLQFGLSDENQLMNLGSVLLSPGRIAFRCLLVGNDEQALEALAENEKSVAEGFGCSAELLTKAKVWNAKDSNRLLDLVSSKYKDMEGRLPQEAQSTTGLECSVYASKAPGLDIISIGPDVWDSGTIEEFCNLESAVKILNLLEGILPEIK